jgi:hypothetical protein
MTEIEEQEQEHSAQYWKAKYEKAAIYEKLAIDEITNLRHFAQTFQKLSEKCERSGSDETIDPATALQLLGQADAHRQTARTFRAMASQVVLGKIPSGPSALTRLYDVYIDMETRRNGD